MITGKELWIDGFNEGIIERYEEQDKGDNTYIMSIKTKRENPNTYETDIICYFTIEQFATVRLTDKKVIVKTYITR